MGEEAASKEETTSSYVENDEEELNVMEKEESKAQLSWLFVLFPTCQTVTPPMTGHRYNLIDDLPIIREVKKSKVLITPWGAFRAPKRSVENSQGNPETRVCAIVDGQHGVLSWE